MFLKFLQIGLAGCCGTLLRYVCQLLLQRFCPRFALGTLLINVLGAFAAGFCYIYLRQKWPSCQEHLPILFVGFFGAFTTFSTFALESANMLHDGRTGLFVLNLALHITLGISAALLGIALASAR